MSFLSDLEKYITKYQQPLNLHCFQVVEKKDGPGMGAFLRLSNNKMGIELINDKGQIFIKLEKEKYSVDLALLLSFIKLEDEKQDLRFMFFEDKFSIWEINYDYSDPINSLLRNFDKIDSFLGRIKVNELKELVYEYNKDRGKWLYR
jgi:hypothetical protein